MVVAFNYLRSSFFRRGSTVWNFPLLFHVHEFGCGYILCVYINHYNISVESPMNIQYGHMLNVCERSQNIYNDGIVVPMCETSMSSLVCCGEGDGRVGRCVNSMEMVRLLQLVGFFE